MPGDRRITLHIGPAPADAVRLWAENRLQLIAASRRASSVSANADALELLESFLRLWIDEVERSDGTFDWTHQLDLDVMLLVGKYWLDLGALSVDEREAMGVPRLAPEVDVVTGVVVKGMVDGLRACGAKGELLLARLSL